MVNKAAAALAAVVVILCAVASISVYMTGVLLDDSDPYPGYSVTGTGPDGLPCTGTASCEDIRESSVRPVLRFSFSVELSDGSTDSFDVHLITDGSGPDPSAYTEEGGSGIAEGCTVWRSVGDPGVTFHIDAEGSVRAVGYSSGGYSLTAQATP